MFSLCRLASRKLPLQPAYYLKPDFLTLARHVKIKATQYKPGPAETHDERNMRIGRPQSPHLTIYAVELPSTLSITHRMTGAALAVYTVFFGVVTLVTPQDFCCYIDMLSELLKSLNLGALSAVPIYLVRFMLAFPFCYHMSNGLRHLIWDLGLFLTVKSVYKTGYLMLFCAFSLTTVVVLGDTVGIF